LGKPKRACYGVLLPVIKNRRKKHFRVTVNRQEEYNPGNRKNIMERSLANSKASLLLRNLFLP
jgi:hypothetical protein